MPQAPGLAVVLVGTRKDSETYVRNKKKVCEEVSIASFGETLAEDATEEEVLKVHTSLCMHYIISSSRSSSSSSSCSSSLHLLFSVTPAHAVADMLRCYIKQLQTYIYVRCLL